MEAVIGGLFALFIAAAGGSITYVLKLDERLDKLEVRLSEEYAKKAELSRITERLDYIILEISHKQ